MAECKKFYRYAVPCFLLVVFLAMWQYAHRLDHRVSDKEENGEDEQIMHMVPDSDMWVEAMNWRIEKEFLNGTPKG